MQYFIRLALVLILFDGKRNTRIRFLRKHILVLSNAPWPACVRGLWLEFLISSCMARYSELYNSTAQKYRFHNIVYINQPRRFFRLACARNRAYCCAHSDTSSTRTVILRRLKRFRIENTSRGDSTAVVRTVVSQLTTKAHTADVVRVARVRSIVTAVPRH